MGWEGTESASNKGTVMLFWEVESKVVALTVKRPNLLPLSKSPCDSFFLVMLKELRTEM